MTDFLDYRVLDRLEFKCWFFGHYHKDIVVEDNPKDGRMVAVYQKKWKVE